MRVAITGASGYLGTCLSTAFREDGHEVLSLSRKVCGDQWIPYSLQDNPRDLPLDGVDVLVHAAYDFSPSSWQEIIKVNVAPSIALFQAAAEANVRTRIFISSMSSFDGCRSHYGRAKRMIEKELLQQGGIVVRPGLVWGARSGGVMGSLERAVAVLPAVPYPSGGKNARQFLIHQLDLSEGLVSLAKRPPLADQNLLSMAHPIPLSLRSILQILANRTNRSRVFLPLPPQCVMVGLKLAEMVGLPIPFRSDSLVGLVHGNPNPNFDHTAAESAFRPFS